MIAEQFGVEYTSPKTGRRRTTWYATPEEARTCFNIYLGSAREGGFDRKPRVVSR